LPLHLRRSFPNTPAGHALAAWLDAFNSGERARFQSFEEAHAPWLILDEEMNPITKTNWEGTGVEPDIKVPAADALDEALKLAHGQ